MRATGIVRAISVFVLALAAGTGAAQTYSWTNAAGGQYSTGTNWSPVGPPAGVGNTLFDLASTYTVHFTAGASSTFLVVDDGNVTFALGGNNYTLNSSNSIVGSAAGKTARLTLTNGSMLVSGSGLEVANSSADIGFLTVGADAVLNSTGVVGVAVGRGGLGSMTVQSGGIVNTTVFNVGTLSTAVGTATVTGTGSAVNTSGNTIIGSSGLGTLTVSSGGFFQSGTTVTLGQAAGGSGTLNVTGTGSTFAAASGQMNIGGSGYGKIAVTSGGLVASSVAVLVGNGAGAGGEVTITGTGSKFTAVGMSIGTGGGTGAVEVLAGGALTMLGTSSVNIANGAGTTGSLLVSGAGSTVAATSHLVVGGSLGINGGTGTMSIESGASVSVTNTTEIRPTAGSALTINGGSLAAKHFNRFGTFNFDAGQLTVSGNFNNGTSPVSLTLNGTTGVAQLNFNGSGTISNVSNILVGGAGHGALTISGGRALTFGTTPLGIGAGIGGQGTMTLSDLGTSFTNTSSLDVGGFGGSAGGAGVLNINAGTQVAVTSFNLHQQGVVNLNGGTVTITNDLFANGGAFNFVSGRVQFNNSVDLTNAKLTALFGSNHEVLAGRTLASTNSLLFNAPTALAGGTIDTQQGIDIANTFIANAGVMTTASALSVSAGKLMHIGGQAQVNATSSFSNSGILQLNDNLVPTTGGVLFNSGVVRGSGVIGNPLFNLSAGQVQVTAGKKIDFMAPTNINDGVISVLGGEVEFAGALTNTANTGLISARDAILRFDGGLNNQQSLSFSNGTVDVYGAIASTRFVTPTNRSRITVSGGGIANFYGDVTVGVGQTDVQVTALGSTISKAVFFGSYNGGATGGGQVLIEGDHRPGASPGLASFGGDVFYGPSAVLQMEIGGGARGTQYDSIDVAGVVGFGGTLDIDLIGGFVPVANQVFTVVRFGSHVGSFDFFQDLDFGFGHFEHYFAGNTFNLRWVVEPVPEPASVLAAVACLASLGALSSRSRARRINESLNYSACGSTRTRI